jgi:conjugal transfer pilin signal peptidase TrbI
MKSKRFRGVTSYWQARRCRSIFILAVVSIWVLAYVRIFLDHTPKIPLLFNWTPSLPYRVAWLESGPRNFARGDYVVFSFSGTAGDTHYPGLRRQAFFKIIKGLPGDEVAVKAREVFVNGESVGVAKLRAFDGRPLEPIAEGVIAPGHFYVQGTDADSFDSRYQSSGLVHIDQIIGKAKPLF